MKELRKIILINSIQAYGEIELDTSLHFQGDNGSGKTDYLQLISAFYTGSLLHPHNSEKGAGHYLPFSNSWIIYEVAAAKGFFSLAFHREDAIPKAYFLNGDYEKECFFKKDKALSWKEVKAELKKRKLHQAGPFELKETYWQILMGSYQGKDKSDLRRYAIMNTPAAAFFPKIQQSLSTKGMISFDFLKEPLCFFEGLQDAKVELNKIDKASKSLRKDIRSIHAWKAAEGEVQALLKEEKRLDLLTEKEENLLQELPASLALHKSEKKKLKSHFEEMKNQWEDLQNLTDARKGENLDSLKKLYLKKGELDFKLSFAREKAENYEKQDIQQKIQQFYELNLRKQQADLLRDLQQDSTKERKKTPAWWEASLKKEKALAELSAKALSQKETLLNQRKAARSALEEEKNSLKILQNSIEKLEKEKRQLEEKRVQLTGGNIGFSAARYKRKIQRALEDSIELKLQIRLSEEQSNALQKRREKEFEVIEIEQKEREKKSLNLLKEKRELHKKLESQIANSGRAFMGWLEKNYPDWQQTIGRLLKDEVLLSPFLSPGIERINELFYGIHLELSELPESSLNLEQLQKDKAQLEKEIAQMEKELAKLQQTYVKQKDSREKYYRQKSRELKRQLQKDEYTLQQLEVIIKKNEAEIDKGSLRKEQEKEAALIKLSYQEADLDEAIKEAEKAFQEAHKKWEGQKAVLEKAEEKDLQKWEAALAKEEEQIQAAWQAFTATDSKDPNISNLGPDIFLWEKLQKEIQLYDWDKQQFIDKLDGWEFENKQLEIQIANREAIEKLSEGDRNRKKELLQEEWEHAQKSWEEWQSLDKAFSTWLKSDSKKLDKQKEVKEEGAEALANRFLQLTEIEKEKKLQKLLLRKKLREVLSYFSRENSFGLELYMENEAEEEKLLLQVKKLFEEGKAEEIIQDIYQRQSEFLAAIHELFSDLQPNLSKLKNRLNKLSKDLHLHFGEHLQAESQFAISYSRKGIFQSLSNLRAFYLEHRDQLGGSSLFNQGDKADLNRQAFQLLEEVDQHLQALPEKELTPFQILELEWKVEGERRLKNFGELSPKTKRGIHSYLAVYLLTEIMAGEKELSFHFFLDDILELDPPFLRYIQEQLKQANLKLCSASSHTSEDISPEKHLYLSRSEKGETVVMPAQA